MNKRINTDSAKWKIMMNKIITQITDDISKRLEIIDENDLKLIRGYETMGDNILYLKVSQAEKNIVSVKMTTKYYISL